LPDINNELAQKNATYKQRIIGLDRFVMVQFTQDTVIFPRISESFGYFANNSVTDVVPLKKSAQYQQDWLGLRTLDQQGKLTFLSCPTDHLHFTHQWFISNLLPYLI
jgi:palmitoyl-protein thioesterase